MSDLTPPNDVPSADQTDSAAESPPPRQAGATSGSSGPDAAPPEGEQPRPPVLIARYGQMRQLGRFRYDLDKPPAPGTKLVLRTDRGVELGEVVIGVDEDHPGCISRARLGEYVAAGGVDNPFGRDGKVLRLANPQDVIDQRHLDSSATEEAAFCRQQIRQLNLEMKLVTVEHLLGGERIIFHFAADHRVDFRELVRRLAAQYRTRIEMRQVGARDEARLVGDYERCGQRCCCQGFLQELKPISMRMAKTQKATLDPAKISGRCGRLMCCLRFEDKVYEELRKRLPRRNTWVRAGEVVGKVIETQIITQLVRLQLADKAQVVVANEEIVERDLEAPPVKEIPPDRPPAKEKEKAPRRLLRDEVPAGAAAGEGDRGDAGGGSNGLGAASSSDKKRKRRRRSRSKRGSGAAGPSASDGGHADQGDRKDQGAREGAASPQAQRSPSGRKRRGGRKRRRKKRK